MKSNEQERLCRMISTHGDSKQKMRAYITWLLYGIAFFMPIHLITMEIVMALCFFLTMYYGGRYGLPKKNVPMLKPILGFAGISLGTTVLSPDPAFSFYNYLFTVFQYVWLYGTALLFLDGRKEQQRCLYAMIGGGIVVLFYGFLQYMQLTDISAKDWVDPAAFPLLKRRMYSTLYNPNLLSAYLLMVIAFLGAFGFASKKRTHQMAYLGLTALFTLSLVLTYSRGAWISAAAMLVFFALLGHRKLFFLFIPLGLLLLFYHGGIVTRFYSIFSGEDTSIMLRYALWDSTEAMIEDHWLTGIGWGAYWLVYPQYNYFIQDPSVIIYHAHNLYIHMMAEIGIPGALCYFWFFFGNIWWSLRLLREEQPFFAKTYARGMIVMTLSIAICSISDHDLFATQISLVYWLFAGILGNLYAEREVGQDTVFREK